MLASTISPPPAVGVRIEEARSGDHVQLGVPLQALEQLAYVAGIVLSIAIYLHRDIVAMLLGVDVAALHGDPDAEIEGQAQDRGARRPGPFGGAVGRAVIDHDDVEFGAQRRVAAIVEPIASASLWAGTMARLRVMDAQACEFARLSPHGCLRSQDATRGKAMLRSPPRRCHRVGPAVVADLPPSSPPRGPWDDC